MRSPDRHDSETLAGVVAAAVARELELCGLPPRVAASLGEAIGQSFGGPVKVTQRELGVTFEVSRRWPPRRGLPRAGRSSTRAR